MRKICAGCGIIFEVKSDPIFCSETCKVRFHTSGIAALKGRPPERMQGISSDASSEQQVLGDDQTEIIRPVKKREA